MQPEILDDEAEKEFRRVINRLKKYIIGLVALVLFSSIIVYILNLLFFLYFTIGIFGFLLLIQIFQSFALSHLYFLKFENSILTLYFTNLSGEKNKRTFKEKDLIKVILNPIEHSTNYRLTIETSKDKNEYVASWEMANKEVIPTISKEWKNVIVEILEN